MGDYFAYGVLVMFLIILCSGSSDESDYFNSLDINKTSHRAETDDFIFVGADNQDIWLENNPNATNTTIEQLIDFIKNDKTDEIIYNEQFFICGDYAEAVHNNAEKQGIKTGWVVVDFYNDDQGHAINVFDTKENGLVFYDSTNDDIGVCDLEYFIDLKIGYELIPIKGNLLHKNSYYETADSGNEYYICDYYDVKIDGVVSNFEIIW